MFMEPSMSAWVPRPSWRSRVIISAFVTPAGIRRPTTPAKIRFVAAPSSRGPSTARVTLTVARPMARTISGRSGRSVPSSRPAEPRKSSDFSVDMPLMKAAGPRRAPGGGPGPRCGTGASPAPPSGACPPAVPRPAVPRLAVPRPGGPPLRPPSAGPPPRARAAWRGSAWCGGHQAASCSVSWDSTISR